MNTAFCLASVLAALASFQLFLGKNVARKKGETRVALPFLVVEPVIQNKIWGLLAIHIQ